MSLSSKEQNHFESLLPLLSDTLARAFLAEKGITSLDPYSTARSEVVVQKNVLFYDADSNPIFNTTELPSWYSSKIQEIKLVIMTLESLTTVVRADWQSTQTMNLSGWMKDFFSLLPSTKKPKIPKDNEIPTANSFYLNTEHEATVDHYGSDLVSSTDDIHSGDWETQIVKGFEDTESWQMVFQAYTTYLLGLLSDWQTELSQQLDTTNVLSLNKIHQKIKRAWLGFGESTAQPNLFLRQLKKAEGSLAEEKIAHAVEWQVDIFNIEQVEVTLSVAALSQTELHSKMLKITLSVDEILSHESALKSKLQQSGLDSGLLDTFLSIWQKAINEEKAAFKAKMKNEATVISRQQVTQFLSQHPTFRSLLTTHFFEGYAQKITDELLPSMSATLLTLSIDDWQDTENATLTTQSHKIRDGVKSITAGEHWQTLDTLQTLTAFLKAFSY